MSGLWIVGLRVGSCWLQIGFVGHRRAVSQGRVQPDRVPAFDVAEAGQLRLRLGGLTDGGSASRHPGVTDARGHGIAVGDATRVYRWPHPSLSAALAATRLRVIEPRRSSSARLSTRRYPDTVLACPRSGFVSSGSRHSCRSTRRDAASRPPTPEAALQRAQISPCSSPMLQVGKGAARQGRPCMATSERCSSPGRAAGRRRREAQSLEGALIASSASENICSAVEAPRAVIPSLPAQARRVRAIFARTMSAHRRRSAATCADAA